MSMLGEQIKELREKADLLDGLEGMDNLVPMLREAADTIEDLRDRLQNQAFALGMQEVLGSGTCEIENEIWRYDHGGDERDTYEFVLSCGHSVEWLDSEPPRHCPECGRKVVSA